MTALAADKINVIVAGGSSRYRVGKVATNVIIYKGALVCANAAGYLVPAADTAGYKFVGIAQEAVNSTGIANGVYECKYLTGVTVKVTNDATNPVAQANLYAGVVWVKDDQTARGTAGNAVVLGIASSIESDGTVMVFVDPLAATP